MESRRYSLSEVEAVKNGVKNFARTSGRDTLVNFVDVWQPKVDFLPLDPSLLHITVDRNNTLLEYNGFRITLKQLQVLYLIHQHVTGNEIAQRLGISTEGVKKNLSRARKLNSVDTNKKPTTEDLRTKANELGFFYDKSFSIIKERLETLNITEHEGFHYSERELAILSKKAEGLTDEKIAEILDVSITTVKRSMRSLKFRNQIPTENDVALLIIRGQSRGLIK